MCFAMLSLLGNLLTFVEVNETPHYPLSKIVLCSLAIPDIYICVGIVAQSLVIVYWMSGSFVATHGALLYAAGQIMCSNDFWLCYQA